MTILLKRCSVCFSLCLISAPLPLAAAPDIAPPVKLARHMEDTAVDYQKYYFSEKYDGVRAWWDGQNLLTRSGRVIAAPAWFTRGFPAEPLDGELWIARGRFAEVSGLVRRESPGEGWREVSYMVFDLPAAEGDYETRYAALGARVRAAANPHLQRVAQTPVQSLQQLQQALRDGTQAGAEGLMLQRRDAPYRHGRSDDLLKLTVERDAEARVVAHLPGKGKYEGAMGALLVEDGQGRRFRIGTGFSDVERVSPPPPGAQITYRYTGQTATGLPRFPRYLRLRPEE
ncbi:DNA ligase [Granulosicoccaceae sp. 1_MG-2023]|nr:DNA ligase [Granulosicoccaceae sp. 1_MG-2023]